MKLKKLFKGIDVEIKGSKDIEVTGICSDSRVVAPGNLFIAKRGIASDGSKYIPQAIAAGAAAVLTDIFDPFEENIVQVIHPEPASIEGVIASNYYGDPSSELLLVGITGTNGKTTSSYLIKHLLDEIKMPSGLIGTVEWIVGNSVFPSTYTTPDVIAVNKLLKEMLNTGCKACTMEVSSHALVQGRVQLIDFDIAVFTNLTQDHLDYHQTMDEYAHAKKMLFASLNNQRVKSRPKFAIVNVDSPYVDEMMKGCRANTLKYGIENSCDIKAENIELSLKGMKFLVSYKGESVNFKSPLIGRYNIYNLLAAISVGVALGVSLPKIAEILARAKKIAGRLERVPNTLGKNIFVDFAHSEDALKNVLETLKEVSDARVITVFGCGGNRDQKKRPLMGKVASSLSDIVIITSDNPRNEDPQKIADDIYQGCVEPSKVKVVLDRKEAITQAIQLAGEKDIVLIAGKGHESLQVFSHQTIEFNDSKIAKAICEEIAASVTS